MLVRRQLRCLPGACTSPLKYGAVIVNLWGEDGVAETVATEKGIRKFSALLPPPRKQPQPPRSHWGAQKWGLPVWHMSECGTLVRSQCPNPGETRVQCWLLCRSAPDGLGRADPRMKAAVIADMHPHTVHACTYVVHVFTHVCTCAV